MRAWTDAEKELDIVRQKAQNTAWYKGYVKGLEGLLLTYRSNDDKYIYLPRALGNRSEDSIKQLQKDFGEFASNEIHGEYDRGFFQSLADYVSMLSTLKTPAPPPEQVQSATSEENETAKQDAGLTPYLEESS
ncbi:MAG TPA: hypothetical protein VE955_12255 [Candidatus Dormibacteraeota bacterium]|jgi:hypothetical protein|nr:hypothetical protein [Candidatus Dormibacteraeota bacterium]